MTGGGEQEQKAERMGFICMVSAALPSRVLQPLSSLDEIMTHFKPGIAVAKVWFSTIAC